VRLNSGVEADSVAEVNDLKIIGEYADTIVRNLMGVEQRSQTGVCILVIDYESIVNVAVWAG